MVRPALFALLLVGCTGDIQSQLTEGLPPAEAVAVEKWAKKALPVFGGERTHCIQCHDGSVANAPAYLAGENDLKRRDTLLAFMPRVVNLLAPQSSRMLTVGDHTMMMGGPALLSNEASACLEWIQAERIARPDIMPIRTQMFTPMLCTGGNPGDATCPVNTVDLSAVGPTPAAGSIEFVLQQLGGDSYFTQLKLKAGADGMYFEHPLFESYPNGETTPTPDPVDRLFAVVMNVQPNMEMAISSGTVTIANFSATAPMTLQFDVIEKYRPGM